MSARVISIIGIIVLGAIGLFVGGCALLFLSDPYTRIPGLQLPCLVVAGLCFWGVIAIARRLDPDDSDPPQN